MNYKPLATLFIATALSGCNLCPAPPQAATVAASPVSSTAPSSTEPIPKATSNKALMNGWEVAVSGVKTSGQIYKVDEYEQYEAADSWTAVTIKITNKTGKRQRDDDAPMTSFATIVDATGKSYDVREQVYSPTDKPFAPGEMRATTLLFDTPENTKPVQLMLDATDSEYPILKLR